MTAAPVRIEQKPQNLCRLGNLTHAGEGTFCRSACHVPLNDMLTENLLEQKLTAFTFHKSLDRRISWIKDHYQLATLDARRCR